MNQPPLPFERFTVPGRHIEWMMLANAGKFSEKKIWFYPFKTRFMREHALPDGFDLQIITLKCWCGDGIWRGIDNQIPERFWEQCGKCGGTGIYLKKRVPLIRWLLNGHLFHEPMQEFSEPTRNYRNEFQGLIQHEEVPERAARRAMEKLMLRYEPDLFHRLWVARWREWKYWKVQKVKWQFAHVNRLLSFTKEDDGVPF